MVGGRETVDEPVGLLQRQHLAQRRKDADGKADGQPPGRKGNDRPKGGPDVQILHRGMPSGGDAEKERGTGQRELQDCGAALFGRPVAADRHARRIDVKARRRGKTG